VPITDLKWIPQEVGEKRLTLKVKPKDGELLTTNNQLSTYVNVKKGGLSVLFLGPRFSWEPKYLIRSVDPAGEIRVDLIGLREPSQGGVGMLKDSDFASASTMSSSSAISRPITSRPFSTSSWSTPWRRGRD